MLQFDKGLDFLIFIRDFHHKLSEFYNKLSIESDKEKIKIILKYIAKHERKMELAIEAYEDKISPRISETWYQFVDKDKARDCFNKIRNLKLDDIGEITKSVVELDYCLINIYKNLADLAPTDEIRKVFKNMSELETHEIRKVVHNIHRYEYL